VPARRVKPLRHHEVRAVKRALPESARGRLTTRGVIIDATTITNKAHMATSRYLTMRGFVILEDGWMHADDAVDFIAYDPNGELVFIKTYVYEDASNGFPEINHDRNAFERIAAAYLSEADTPDCMVRFDTVMLVLVGNERALVKHCVDVLGEAL